MSQIAINTREIPVPQKLIKGQELITKGTANPNVPGNTALLTALTARQEALEAAEQAAEENRLAGKQLTAARNAALEGWNAAVVALAGFTEGATGGDAAKILTTGFDVRSEPTPPQPVPGIINVRVEFTGMPGHSLVRWKRESNAEAYVVQRSPDPITDTSWSGLGTVTEAKFEGNGTIPGLKYWYRVAGVNRLGQGPWSEPALRPVM